ncbi:peptide-methionine (S)-S-oxide reductase MsrA [Mycoplasma sp. 4013]
MNKEVYLAGGCFWGVEAFFQKVKGVLSTSVHYINGGSESVSYRQVCNGSSHAEAVKIIYDADVLTPNDIFKLFLLIINPYSLNKQGNDRGVQYRVGIYTNETALRAEFKKLNQAFKETEGKDNYIEILPVSDDTKAEEYHQNYLNKNPFGYCHINLDGVPSEYRK